MFIIKLMLANLITLKFLDMKSIAMQNINKKINKGFNNKRISIEDKFWNDCLCSSTRTIVFSKLGSVFGDDILKIAREIMVSIIIK